jgi:SAM-dependent methyltransferase
MYRLAMRVKRPVIRRWYDLMSRIDKHDHMVFMNYGWASLDSECSRIPLHSDDEKDRYCIQLYDRVAGAVNLKDKDVLEIGSGRGGGASWVSRYFEPRSMVGMDLSPVAVEYCSAHYQVPGLSFVTGDAEALDFAPESFDAVINVESSHCYSSMERFLEGISRVLRPGGHFLYTDYHSPEGLKRLRTLLESSGFRIVCEEDIGLNVLKALELDDERKSALIQDRVPVLLRGLVREFAGMQGTATFNGTLRTGERIYSRFVLQKPCRDVSEPSTPMDCLARPGKPNPFGAAAI